MSSEILIRGGRLLLPSRGMDGKADILVSKGRVVSIGPKINPSRMKRSGSIFNAEGIWVAPGLVDIHTHLREPGYEYKETIATGTAAAAAGGFTSVLCMANTSPVNDNAAVTRFILKKVQEEGLVKVHPVGAVTVGQRGKTLSEMVDLAHNGCVAFSDDGHPVMNAFIMRKAMEYMKYTGKPFICHGEDTNLAAGGVCHEGRVSFILGLKGIPSEAEEVIIARDISICRLTGGRLHFAHISTRGAVELIALAKEEGLPVTAEVTPHHLFLTEEALFGFDPNTKVNPPFREEEDRQALRMGLKEGIIDCIASDHAPHGLVDKDLEYDLAAFGISGLETALPLGLELVEEGMLSPLELIDRMSRKPAEIIGLEAGDLVEGGPADIILIDPKLQEEVRRENFLSKGKNTPFEGWKLTGRAVLTMVEGRRVFTHPSAASRLERFRL